MKVHLIFILSIPVLISCSETSTGSEQSSQSINSGKTYPAPEIVLENQLSSDSIHLTKPDIQVEPDNSQDISIIQKSAINNPIKDSLMQFAESLIGIPYRYGSSDPRKGFDCSGFITYVFNHFNVEVPRSSVDFTNKGEALEEAEARRGDIILFTGTNPEETFVGHMGLIISNNDNGLRFIHSTSGKAKSVTITQLNPYYRNRLVGFRRIL